MAARVDPLARLRKICLALPEAEEFVSHGEAAFRIKKQRVFAMFANHHHDDGRIAVWLKAAPGAQEMLIESQPDRFFRPPYVGPSGWVGVLLDARTDWAMVGELVEEGWRLIAPKKLLAAHALARPACAAASADAERQSSVTADAKPRKSAKAPAKRPAPSPRKS